jgi:hypothetical protein
VCALPLSVLSALIASAACCYVAVAGNLKDFMTAAQLSGNVPRTVNSSSDRERPVFDPAADPKKSKDSQKIREKVRRRAVLVSHVSWWRVALLVGSVSGLSGLIVSPRRGG